MRVPLASWSIVKHELPAVEQGPENIFHPFAQWSNWGRGRVLRAAVHSPTYAARYYDPRGPQELYYDLPAVPYLKLAAVHDEEGGTVTVFALNRHLEEKVSLDLTASGFGAHRSATARKAAACSRHRRRSIALSLSLARAATPASSAISSSNTERARDTSPSSTATPRYCVPGSMAKILFAVAGECGVMNRTSHPNARQRASRRINFVRDFSGEPRI